MKQVFWFLSIYSVRPDGSTLMIFQHHNKLLQSGINSYIVYNNQNGLCWIGSEIKNVITLYDRIRMVDKNSILISSWDQHVQNTFLRLPGKKIAYLQSHFANQRQSYDTQFQIWTVSNFAKDYIKQHYNKEAKLLKNVVRLPQQITPIPFVQKQNKVVTAFPRRDQDVLYTLMNQHKIQVQVIDWSDRIKFLSQVNKRRYYLSYYREDAFGLPPIEAMRMGTIPIVVSNSTGRDYGRHLQNGFFNYSEVSLDGAISGIATDQYLMSRKAMKTADEYKNSNILELI